MSVVVTGGSGLVGLSLKKLRPDWVYLSSRDYDLVDQSAAARLFKDIKPKGLIHLAARVGGIKANASYPAEFLYENVMMNTNVVHQAFSSGVRKLLAVLSTCAFPDVVPSYPFSEKDLHKGPPAETNLAYGYAKRLLEVQIKAYRKQYGVPYVSASPCNLYGPGDNFNPEECHLVPALIVKFLTAKEEGRNQVELWGTGKPVRQQLFSEDLARILIHLFDNYDDDETLLVAHPQSYSIEAIAKTVARVVGYEGSIYFNGKLDGQFCKDASIEKLSSHLPSFNFTSLEDGVRLTLDWYIANRKKPTAASKPQRVIADVWRLNEDAGHTAFGNKALHLFILLKLFETRGIQPILPCDSKLDNVFTYRPGLKEELSQEVLKGIPFIYDELDECGGTSIDETLKRGRTQYENHLNFLKADYPAEFTIRGHFWHHEFLPTAKTYNQFLSIRPEILETLLTKYPSIVADNAVAVHLRDGDFANHLRHIFKHGIMLDDNYYVKAVQEVEKRLGKDVEYHLYSDNINRLTSIMKSLGKKYVVHTDNAYIDWVGLFSMRKIISSNSTYSWTASAYNKDLIVQPHCGYNYFEGTGSVPYGFHFPNAVIVKH